MITQLNRRRPSHNDSKLVKEQKQANLFQELPVVKLVGENRKTFGFPMNYKNSKCYFRLIIFL